MFDSIGHLTEKRIQHTVSDNGHVTVGGYLDLRGTPITALPDGLTVGGWLNLSDTPITVLPDNLSVGGSLDLGGTSITTLPDGLTVGGSLYLRDTPITTLPEKFTCRSLYLDPERISIIAYRKGCGRSGRTVFAAWTGKEIRIAAGCFFDTLDAFERAVDVKYTGKAADDYKQAARECVADLLKDNKNV